MLKDNKKMHEKGKKILMRRGDVSLKVAFESISQVL